MTTTTQRSPSSAVGPPELDRPAPAHTSLGTRMRRSWQLYVLLTPPLAYALIFMYGPLFGLQIAFKDFSVVKGILGSPWVGLTHVVRFVESYEFWTVLKNTLLLSSYELLALFPLPIILAVMLNMVRWKGYKKSVQMITYAPHFVSTVVVVGMIIMIFSTTGGLVNNAITAAGGAPVDFLATDTWRHTFVWSGAWQTLGFSAIIYLAALSSVDPQLYEAARMDGAGALRRVWHIDLPTILPVMITLLILNMGSVLNVGFEKVLLMQNPLNLSVSEVIDTYSYRVAFMSSIPQYSYASAIGLFKSIIGMAMLVLANWFARRVAKESLF